MTPIF